MEIGEFNKTIMEEFRANGGKPTHSRTWQTVIAMWSLRPMLVRRRARPGITI